MKRASAISFVLATILALASLAQAQTQSSNSVTFTVVALPPCSIATLAPTQAYVGTLTNMTITGAGFGAGSTVTYDGVALTSTVASPTSITLAIPAAKVTLGAHAIIVNCTVPLLSMLTPVTLPNATRGQAYSANLVSLSQLKGGLQPYQFSLGVGSTLPTGLILSSAGVVTGTPSGVAGKFGFTYTVKDASGTTAHGGDIFVRPPVQLSAAR